MRSLPHSILLRWLIPLSIAECSHVPDILDYLPVLDVDFQADPAIAVTIEGPPSEQEVALKSQDDWEFVRDISGRAYWCDISSLSQGSPQGSQTAEQLLEAGTALVNSMSKCVFRVIDWWTYEICFRKHIRQFHFHPEHQVLEEYTLGRYEAGLEEVRELHGGDLLYVAQRYRGGTLCHLTGKERQAEIRYFCDPDAASIEIHGLREKQTCEYVVEVRSNLVCLDPAFTKRRRPIRVKCHRNATQDGTDNLGLISLDADSRRLLQLEPPQHQDRWPAKADATQAESKSPLANLFSDDGSAVLDAEDRYIRLFKAVGVTSRDIELYTKWKKLTASKSNKGGNAGHDGINKEVDPKEAANKKGKSGTKASGQTDDKNL